MLQGVDTDLSPAIRAHIQACRLFLRDFAELNLLTRGEESSDRFLFWATLDFLSDFNGTPPFTSFGLDTLQSRGLASFAIRGTVVALLQSLLLLYARNHLPFQDGGISVDLNNKGLNMQLLGLMQSAYEQRKTQVKIAFNCEELLGVESGGVLSDYSATSALGYYG